MNKKNNDRALKYFVTLANALPKNPIGLLFFLVGAIIPICLLVASKIQNETYLLILAISALLLILAGMYGHNRLMKSVTYSKEPSSSKIDSGSGIYVSTPMAGFGNDNDLKKHKRGVSEILKTLRKDCGVSSVFCAFDSIDSENDFENKEKALKENFDRINSCALFILILPDQVYSSVFIEFGIALALKKKCILFLPTDEKIPFLLKGAANLHSNEFKHIPVYREIKADGIKRELLGKRDEICEWAKN